MKVTEGQTGGFGEQEAREESGIASEESSVLSQGPAGGERARGKWDGARVCGNRLLGLSLSGLSGAWRPFRDGEMWEEQWQGMSGEQG